MQSDLISKVASDLPGELRAALEGYGVAKVASTLLGTPVTEYDVYVKIGTELARRNIERRAIDKGLEALAALEAR